MLLQLVGVAIVVALSCLSCWTLGFFVFIYVRDRWKLHPLLMMPGPPLSDPIRGALGGHFERNCRLIDFALESRKTYGRLRRVYLPFGELRVELSDHRLAKWVLHTNAKNYSRGNLKGVEELIAVVGRTSLLITSGAYHRYLRKIANPAFKQTLLTQFLAVFGDRTARLIDRWSRACDGRSDAIVPVKIDISKLTLDIIGLAAFGYDFDAVRTPNAFAEAFHFITLRCMSVLPSVPGYWLFRALLVKIGTTWPNARGIDIVTKFLDVLRLRKQVKALIAHKMKQSDTSDEKPPEGARNLMDIILSELSAGTVSVEELQDMAMTFLLAGHETSSIALSWLLLLLAQSQEWQDRCRAEIIQVIGDGAEMSWELIAKLKVLNACVFEALRLFPPVPYVNRCSLAEDTLDGYRIPKGIDFLIIVCEIHRDPDVWGEDANEFQPERFLVDDNVSSKSAGGERKEIPWDAFLPFGDGVHKCIGYQFATAEVISIATSLIRRFEFSVVPGDTFTERVHVTMEPQPSLRLKIRRLD